MATKLPSFDSLPLKKDGPPRNAWGLFGDDDQLGRLNLLTKDKVTAAAGLIKEGTRVALDWPLNKPSAPSFDRKPFKHEIKRFARPGSCIYDDFLDINTQSSTQWDGFRHYGT